MRQQTKQRWLQRYMNCVGPFGNLMFYFQAYEIFASRTTGPVSLPGFSISVIALSSWLFYGLAIRNTPLIIANIVGLTGALIVVAGLLIY